MISDHLDSFESDISLMLQPPCSLCGMDIQEEHETFTWANGSKAHLACKAAIT